MSTIPDARTTFFSVSETGRSKIVAKAETNRTSMVQQSPKRARSKLLKREPIFGTHALRAKRRSKVKYQALEVVLKPNHLSLYGLITLVCVIEIILGLSDRDIFGPANVRQWVYHYGAFWPGLLIDWKPNYTAQPYAMFVTYGVLHGGLWHLAVNMVTLWSLGRAILGRVGWSPFAILYLGSTLGAAAAFALLAPSLRPMVGASGALFGLLGALLAWQYVDRNSDGLDRRYTALAVALLVGLNFVLWWATDGQLAWQAHLGGFVTGWILALFFTPAPGNAS